MFGHIKPSTTFLFVALLSILISCDREDPGPLQETRKEYPIVDFDRLEMGSAFHIEVEQANTFGVEIKGDRRNIDDIDVFKTGSTLIIKFDDNANRHHDTYIKVTMPRLQGVNFSGASVSAIRGFESDSNLDLYLSGASVAQLDADYPEIKLILSGASTLVLHGSGQDLNAEVSGASALQAFDYLLTKAIINVSGASEGRVTVADELKVTASGASSILYRGNPVVISNTSGASTVQKD